MIHNGKHMKSRFVDFRHRAAFSYIMDMGMSRLLDPGASFLL